MAGVKHGGTSVIFRVEGSCLFLKDKSGQVTFRVTKISKDYGVGGAGFDAFWYRVFVDVLHAQITLIYHALILPEIKRPVGAGRKALAAAVTERFVYHDDTVVTLAKRTGNRADPNTWRIGALHAEPWSQITNNIGIASHLLFLGPEAVVFAPLVFSIGDIMITLADSHAGLTAVAQF